MKKGKTKIIINVILTISIILIGINTYAHSGRTDSSGGHKDNKNKSGLGSYHYHCGGNPAHLHTNGICPYSSNAKSSGTGSSTKSTKSSTPSSSSATQSGTTQATKTTTEAPKTVIATGIQINENIESLEAGKSKTLTATITPSDTTDKSVTWQSSDNSIATVSTTGEIVAKKAGTVEITANTSNGKTNTIKINIKETPKKENNTTNTTNTTKTAVSNNSNNTNNTSTNNQEESNPVGGIITLGLLGGGGYWGYKKLKNKNKGEK